MRIKPVLSTISLLLAVGCGDKGDDSSEIGVNFLAADVTLDALPSAASLVSSSPSLALAVSGNPTPLDELAEDIDAIDDAFFSGALAKLNADESVTDEIRQSMEIGQDVCGIAQTSASVVQDLNDGGTLCYMKSLAKLPSGSFTVSQASESVTQEDYSGMFAQEAEDKIVRIDLVGEGDQVGKSAHIKVVGTNNAENKYRVEFFMCENKEGTMTPDSKETYEIDYGTGVYTEFSEKAREDHNGTRLVTAYLRKDDDGKLVFDLSRERSVVSESVETYQDPEDNTYNATQKLEFIINADQQLETRTYRSSEGNGRSDSEKLWSLAEFVGSGESLAISEMAMRADRSWDHGSENKDSREGGGAVEWQDTKYSVTEESDFYAQFEAKNLADDSFFESAPDSEGSINYDGLDCGEEVDVVVQWGLTSESFVNTGDACDAGGDSKIQFHEMCHSSEIRSAFDKLHSDN